jgi:hypothetical protein
MEKKMGMIGEKCPCVACRARGWEQIAQAIEEVIAILIIPEYASALYSPDDDVVHNTMCI